MFFKKSAIVIKEVSFQTVWNAGMILEMAHLSVSSRRIFLNWSGKLRKLFSTCTRTTKQVVVPDLHDVIEDEKWQF